MKRAIFLTAIMIFTAAGSLAAGNQKMMVEYLVQQRVRQMAEKSDGGREADEKSAMKEQFVTAAIDPQRVCPPEPAAAGPRPAPPVQSPDRPAVETRHDPFPYAVQVLAERSRDRAVYVAATLRKTQVTAYTAHVRLPNGEWHRVLIGAYPSYAKAHQAALELRKRRFKDAFVVKAPYAVRLGPFTSDLAQRSAELELERNDVLAYRLPMPSRCASSRETNLLVGAFASHREAGLTLKMLEQAGFRPMVVQR